MARAVAWITVSLAVHVALAIAMPLRVMRAGGTAAFPPPPLEVRMVMAATDLVPFDAGRVPEPAVPPVKTAVALAEPTSVKGLRASSEVQPGPAEPESPAEALAVLEFDPMQYIPSRTLPVRPEPIGHIAIPYPETGNGREAGGMSLTLFIDEDGQVVHIDLEDPTVPRAFQQAAWTAFSQGRFRPGRLDDAPVKTRMRVEVLFEDGTIPH